MRRHVDVVHPQRTVEWNGLEEQEGASPDADWWLVGSFIFGSEPWVIDLANWAPAIDRSWTALLCSPRSVVTAVCIRPPSQREKGAAAVARVPRVRDEEARLEANADGPGQP
jgi:hypothetical protein